MLNEEICNYCIQNYINFHYLLQNASNKSLHIYSHERHWNRFYFSTVIQNTSDYSLIDALFNSAYLYVSKTALFYYFITIHTLITALFLSDRFYLTFDEQNTF